MPFPSSLPVTPELLLPILREHLPLSVTVTYLENRPGALVGVVEPDDKLRRLTRAIEQLDNLPLHREGRDFRYHMTLVRSADPDLRAKATRAIEGLLPHEENVRELLRFDYQGSELHVSWSTSV